MLARAVGAGAFPSQMGGVAVSYLLAVATATDAGIAVTVRPKWLRRLVQSAQGNRREPGPSVWYADWSEISAVDLAGRSMILHKNTKSCRFAVPRRRRLQPLIEVLQAQGVPVRHVTTTLGWFLSGSH